MLKSNQIFVHKKLRTNGNRKGQKIAGKDLKKIPKYKNKSRQITKTEKKRSIQTVKIASKSLILDPSGTKQICGSTITG